MRKNPYFLDNTSEQSLVEDLTKEMISAMGREVYYIPRQLFNEDILFGEDTVSKFKGSFSLPMYVNSISGFEGQGDLATKFGIDLKDRVELVVSKKVFNELVTRSDSTINRPREGDLIYFRDSDTIFEINFVEHENPFYPLGKLYTFVLTCETFVYSQEDFDTGQSFIDDIETDQADTAFELIITTTTGDYISGEVVYQIIGNTASGPTAVTLGNANGTGKAFSWDSDNGVMILGDQSGTFDIKVDEYIYGASSGRIGQITTVTRTDLKIPQSTETGTLLSDSLEIEKERRDLNLFDFSTKDPFSEGDY